VVIHLVFSKDATPLVGDHHQKQVGNLGETTQAMGDDFLAKDPASLEVPVLALPG
jgi:hypothetical protein